MQISFGEECIMECLTFYWLLFMMNEKGKVCFYYAIHHAMQDEDRVLKMQNVTGVKI